MITYQAQIMLGRKIKNTKKYHVQKRVIHKRKYRQKGVHAVVAQDFKYMYIYRNEDAKKLRKKQSQIKTAVDR